jgi:hypothetical protein
MISLRRDKTVHASSEATPFLPLFLLSQKFLYASSLKNTRQLKISREMYV